MKKTVAIAFAVMGAFAYLAPGFNGLLFDTLPVSAGEGRMFGAIYLVGAALLWFMPERSKK